MSHKGMGENKKLWSYKDRICLQCFMIVFIWETISAQIHYSIPEEMQKGSFVGNIAKDLGMDRNHLSDREFRILTKTGMIKYFALNYNNGHLQISERIDREEICGRAEKCTLNFQVIVESKRKLYGIEVEVTDINDNAPQFPPGDQEVQYSIPEETEKDSFVGNLAQDLGLELRDLSKHKLSISEKQYFSLNEHNGNLYVKDRIDREEICGKSSSCVLNLEIVVHNPLNIFNVKVFIDDVNDNAPYFQEGDIQIEMMLLTIVVKLQRSRSPTFLQCFVPDPCSKTGTIFPPNYEEGTLPYSYQICLSSESRRNELTFLQPSLQIAENILGSGNPEVSLMFNEGNNLNSEQQSGEMEVGYQQRSEDSMEKVRIHAGII
ncbi:hypothetical protein JRQ81_010675 [Phrynocephalus forsythii]|uniref:Cadherin domain-containing protein n=1 Tax=Phrynocephalus forsythii TaxID=171643 RepID=A0A9Q0Y285_9SAUR|nr:hypothetical protein JRQ81_010675 [Phrynocephalus forsythii]